MEEKRDLIGQILISRFGLTEWPIVFALNKQAKEKVRLCSLLLKEKAATEEVLARALSIQLGVNALVMSKTTFLLSALTEVPEEFARRESVLPVQVIGNIIVLACADPSRRRSSPRSSGSPEGGRAAHLRRGDTQAAIERAYHIREIAGAASSPGRRSTRFPETTRTSR